MGLTFYKVIGILLSVTVVVLGTATTIVLYLAGQTAIDFFYTGTTRDVDGRLHRRQAADDWYGVLLLRGWAVGFIYITPGIYGIASSLFFNKCLMGVSLVAETLVVTAGSFLHTAGALGLLLYYFLAPHGIDRSDPSLTHCIFNKLQRTDTYPVYWEAVPVDERCQQGRKLLMLAVGALCAAFLAWFLTLITLMCRGFLIHQVPKSQKNQSSTTEALAPSVVPSGGREPARVRRWKQGTARPVASASNADREADIGMSEGARPKRPYDGVGARPKRPYDGVRPTTPEVGTEENVAETVLDENMSLVKNEVGSSSDYGLAKFNGPIPDTIVISVDGESTPLAHLHM